MHAENQRLRSDLVEMKLSRDNALTMLQMTRADLYSCRIMRDHAEQRRILGKPLFLRAMSDQDLEDYLHPWRALWRRVTSFLRKAGR